MDQAQESPLPKRFSRLRRILALLLAITTAGLGHIVLGYPKKGIGWFGGSQVATFAALLGTLEGAPRLALLSFAMLLLIRLAAIADTLRLVPPAAMPRRMTTILLVAGLLIASELGGSVTLRSVQAARLASPSMYPTIENGEYVLVSRVSRELKRGQIVKFLYPVDPSKYYVKRIVAVGGDTIEMHDGQLIVNGRPIERQRTQDECRTREVECTIWAETLDGKTYRVAFLIDAPNDPVAWEFGPRRIPDGSLFVLGDNRDNSADSRYWGEVPIQLVQGVPKFIYWSSDEARIRWNRIGQSVE